MWNWQRSKQASNASPARAASKNKRREHSPDLCRARGTQSPHREHRVSSNAGSSKNCSGGMQQPGRAPHPNREQEERTTQLEFPKQAGIPKASQALPEASGSAGSLQSFSASCLSSSTQDAAKREENCLQHPETSLDLRNYLESLLV